jgi:putative phosphoribosyl transferase
MPFIDRVDAGRRLAGKVRHLRGEDVVVLGLPRGGVQVAFEVARELGAPLDVLVVRKLGVSFQPELAMGAVGEGDVLVMIEPVVRRAHVSKAELAEIERRARSELDRRVQQLRRDRPRLALTGRTVVLVDDGIATGATVRAACQVARAQGASRVVVAVPVCSPDTAERLRKEVDELVCLESPAWFFGVGQFYADFRQVSDDEVVDLLRRAADEEPTVAGAADPPLRND